jgi:hypothetical protein
MKTSTIKVSDKSRLWWKRCCDRLEMNSVEAFDTFMLKVQEHKRNEFFKSLPMPHDFKKRLEGKRIDKSQVTKEVYKK